MSRYTVFEKINQSSPFRLGVAVTLAVVALAAVSLFSADQAEWILRYIGYYFTLVAFLWAIYYGYRVLRQGSFRFLNRKELVVGGVSVFVGALCIFLHSNFGYKIAMDDYLLAGTAKQLHETKQLGYATFGERVGDVYYTYNTVTDKRPWFYPFLVASLHDILGYSDKIPFWLNAAVCVVFLALVYLFACLFAGPPAGMFSVLLWVTLPLLEQNATGAGMEMLNLCLLQLLLLLSVVYLRQPTVAAEGLLSLCAVLLTYTRYESGLFIIPVLIVIAVGWWQRRAVLLSWGSVFAPGLLFAVLLQTKIYSQTESSWELAEGVSQAFSLSHFGKNWPHALNFFLDTGDGLANSWLLGALAVPAIFSFYILMRTELKRYWQKCPAGLVAFMFSIFLLLHFLIILCYHSAELDQRYVSRYGLPFHLLIVIAMVALVKYIAERWSTVWLVVCSLTGFFFFGVTLPIKAKGIYNDSNFVVREFNWFESLAETTLETRSIIVDGYPAFWSLNEWSCLELPQLIKNANVLEGRAKQGILPTIYVVRRAHFVGLEFLSDDAAFDQIREEYDLKLVAEKSFYPMKLTQVYKLEISGNLSE